MNTTSSPHVYRAFGLLVLPAPAFPLSFSTRGIDVPAERKIYGFYAPHLLIYIPICYVFIAIYLLIFIYSYIFLGCLIFHFCVLQLMLVLSLRRRLIDAFLSVHTVTCIVRYIYSYISCLYIYLLIYRSMYMYLIRFLGQLPRYYDQAWCW